MPETPKLNPEKHQAAEWLLTRLNSSRQVASGHFVEFVAGGRQTIDACIKEILDLGIFPKQRFSVYDESGRCKVEEKPAIHAGYLQELGDFHIIILPNRSIQRRERLTEGEGKAFSDEGRELSDIEFTQNGDRIYETLAQTVSSSIA